MLCSGVLTQGVVLAGCSDSDSSDKDAAADEGPGTRRMRDAGEEEVDLSFMCKQTECSVPLFNAGFLLDAGVDLGGIDLGDLNLPPDLLGELVGITPEGCCVGDDGDVCGVTEPMELLKDGTCLEQAQVGKPDPECPDEKTEIDGVDVPFNGCCKPDNTCGVNLDPIGIGCLERTVAYMIEMNVTGPVDGAVPYAAMSCNYSGEMDGGSNDGGTEDGG
jgi:hypothetical protein